MILNINKPKEWTSFDVVAKTRGLLRKQTGKKKIKVGHAGTLDPLAEGVLIILTSHDTKKQDLIMKKPKEYIAKIAFGAKSPTYDLEGDLELIDSDINLSDLKKNLEMLVPKFIGELEQVVPPFSAAKVDGKRLYDLARSGENVEEILPTKRITIHEFEMIGLNVEEVKNTNLPVLECRVVCSSGTYLRSIANDLGEELGIGGVLTNLIRSRVGEYTINDSVKIEDLEKVLQSHPVIV